MKHQRVVGIALSIAVGLSFTMLPESTALAIGSNEKVKCFGVNSCKGHGACSTSINSCQGKNACKAQGFLMVSWNECQKMGGSLQDPNESLEPESEQ